ncbi:MAG: carotenoid biosynthesis protein [Bdellovibrionota bacterium]
MEDVGRFFELLWGSVVYRPYVYAFFVCFLVFAQHHLGLKRMLTFMVSTYIIAFLCEYSATRNGFPFGFYTYIDTTRDRELWISNVPVWDSLSFVFLSYFSYLLAAALLMKSNNKRDGDWPSLRYRLTPVLGGVLMTLLDVVIDPVALQGGKWFLGEIYYYPHKGFYFGVTAANFAGWFFVGFATQRVFQRFLEHAPWCKDRWRPLHPRFVWGIFAVYTGVFIFNLGITVMIKDYVLATASTAVILITLVPMGFFIRRRRLSWKY